VVFFNIVVLPSFSEPVGNHLEIVSLSFRVEDVRSRGISQTSGELDKK
jgi:hypothetical protein